MFSDLGLGAVTGAEIVSRRNDGRSRGFGFVDFEDEATAKKALEATKGQKCHGRTLIVKPARTRPTEKSTSNPPHSLSECHPGISPAAATMDAVRPIGLQADDHMDLDTALGIAGANCTANVPKTISFGRRGRAPRHSNYRARIWSKGRGSGRRGIRHRGRGQGNSLNQNNAECTQKMIVESPPTS